VVSIGFSIATMDDRPPPERKYRATVALILLLSGVIQIASFSADKCAVGRAMPAEAA
jgi:hypothetical protein